jgi:hypothetical protein
MKPWEIGVFGGLGAAFLVVVYLILSAPEGEADWEAYVRDHHCTPVGAMDGSNRGGWRCDDGKVHYRWRQQR